MCSDEIKETITTLLILSPNDSNRIEVESVSQGSGSAVSARIKMLPTNNEGRRLRQSKALSKSVSDTNHSVGLFRELQKAVEEEQSKARILVAADTESPGLRTGIVSIGEMKIMPGQSDMKLVKTDPGMQEEEEELYRYASMKGTGGSSQPIMSKVERKTMIDEIKKEERSMVKEIENKSKIREKAIMNEIKDSKTREETMIIREEAMMSKIERMSDIEDALFHELKQSKEKSLRFEWMVVTLVCVGISFFAFLSLKRW